MLDFLFKGNRLIYAIIIAFFVAIGSLHYGSVENVKQVKIKDKERVVKGEESYYLIYTDKGVYKNTDTIFFFKLNSSDVYNNLEVNSTCDIKTNWFRVPLLSMYQNVIKIEKCY